MTQEKIYRILDELTNTKKISLSSILPFLNQLELQAKFWRLALGLYLICLLFSSSLVSASASQFSENLETPDSINPSQNSDQQVQTSNSLAESISIKDSYILKKNGVLTNLKKDIAISDISNFRDSVYISDSVIISKKSVSQTHTSIMAIPERILERSKLSKQYN